MKQNIKQEQRELKQKKRWLQKEMKQIQLFIKFDSFDSPDYCTVSQKQLELVELFLRYNTIDEYNHCHYQDMCNEQLFRNYLRLCHLYERGTEQVEHVQ